MDCRRKARNSLQAKRQRARYHAMPEVRAKILALNRDWRSKNIDAHRKQSRDHMAKIRAGYTATRRYRKVEA